MKRTISILAAASVLALTSAAPAMAMGKGWKKNGNNGPTKSYKKYKKYKKKNEIPEIDAAAGAAAVAALGAAVLIARERRRS